MRFTTSHAAALAVASTALVGGGIAVANAADDAGSADGTSATTDDSGRGDGSRGGPGGSQDTPVTGAEKTKVVDAVEAAHDGVTITDVRQDPDGSYDALGTDADDNPVFYDVSADLATITEHTGGAGGPGGHGGHGGKKGDGSQDSTPSESASPSTT